MKYKMFMKDYYLHLAMPIPIICLIHNNAGDYRMQGMCCLQRKCEAGEMAQSVKALFAL